MCILTTLIVALVGCSSMSKYEDAYNEYEEKFKVGNYRYQGYQTLESMFNNCVTKNIEYYDYQSTVQ